MAVDTRAKRLSMANMLHGNLLPDPNTNGVDAGERATFLLLYSGLALDAGSDGLLDDNYKLSVGINRMGIS